MPHRPSAQRLSASQRVGTRAAKRCADSRWCSTPFGITEVGTLAADAFETARLVLNAFRHHRGRHERSRLRHRRGHRWCSTPFGITEVGTGKPPDADSTHAARCSTPFGITEVGTRTRTGTWSIGSSEVLNAFRHHRGRHSATQAIADAAGVLNAFRHHRGRHAEGAWSRLSVSSQGAQRLSASQRSARRGSKPPRAAYARPVLNAFRHHRGRHSRFLGTPRDRARPAGPVVLNAFRHHRGRHLPAETRRGSPKWGVLNAFRHHRGRHQRGVLAGDPGRSAQRLRHHRGSAPWRDGRPQLIAGAQRLSASQRSAPPCRARLGSTDRRFGSAQRLSASQRSAHLPAPWSGAQRTRPCSTPFGITEVGTRHRCIGRPHFGTVPVLNALRHHRGRHCLREVGPTALPGVLNAFRHHRGRH